MTTQTKRQVRVEPTQKRIRTQVGGVVIADSTDVLMVWEVPYFPTYYFPSPDVRLDLLSDSGEIKRSPSRGTTALHDINVGDRTVPHAARVWTESKVEQVAGYVSFHWGSMDAWFEEEAEVYVHARDPHTRIDILQSSRNIRVEIDGVTIADTDQPWILFETGLPARYYIPKTDVHFQHLVSTETATACPYKGTARYWSITVNGQTHDDLAWGYDSPLQESQDIAGFISFYNEKVDIFVDGELQDRPTSMFS